MNKNLNILKKSTSFSTYKRNQNKYLSIPFYAILLALFFIFCASCSTNQTLTRKEKKSLHQEITTSPIFSKNHTGFALYDLRRKEMLYTSEADKYYTPASNTKIFTLYTAMNILGDSIPALNYQIQGDSLIFWGTGDPSLLNPKLPPSDRVVNFLKNSPEKLFYSPSNFMDARYGAGWAWDDYLYSYQVAKSAMPIYGNLVSIEKKVDTSLLTILPSSFQAQINDTLGIERARPRYKRAIHNNQITLEGQLAKNKEFYQEIPFLYSDTLLVTLLSKAVDREIQLLQDYQLPQNKVHKLYSIAADSAYQLMMEDSDNFVAEQLLLLCANEIFDTLNTRKIITYAKDSLLKDLPDPLQWRDGSGLSRYNLFTPQSIVRLLEKIYEQLSLERLQAIFPEGGESGTIKNFYESPTKPFLYAKTGTLSNRHCLSGYLFTKSGEVLIFSFMHNNYLGSSAPLKKEMDKILRKLYEEY